MGSEIEEVNVVIPQQAIIAGSPFYRPYQPIFKAAELGYINAKICGRKFNELKKKAIDNVLWGADIHFSILQTRKTADAEAVDIDRLFDVETPKYNRNRTAKHRLPLNVVVDIDDWSFECPAFNNSYVFFGEKEVISEFDNDEAIFGKEWIDKKTAVMVNGFKQVFDIEANKKYNERSRTYLRKAHAVTAATEYLAGKVREFNNNVYVLPNGVDLTLYEPQENDSGYVRIGYMFGASHLIDWLDIAPHLRKVINSHINVKLVLFGTMPGNLCGIDEDKIEFHKYKGVLDGYHKTFSGLKLDIGICPLFDDEFNKCKSNLKWLEYSAVKAVTLAPRVLYGDYIHDGRNGFIYHNHDEFVGLLRYLIKRKETRKKIGEAAYKYVKANYSIDVVAKKYGEVFKQIVMKGAKRYEKELTGSIS